MPVYDFRCTECAHTESIEQKITVELVNPKCSKHGEMVQNYNFGVRMVFGAGSSPSRSSNY